MRVKTLLAIGALAWAAGVIAAASPGGRQAPAPAVTAAATPPLFETADRCQACHNGLLTASGRDVSIGVDWRTSMMAQRRARSVLAGGRAPRSSRSSCGGERDRT